MGLIDKTWLPTCAMKRVICHWTAGGYEASSIDLPHYHILIEKSGKLVRGTHSILDNVSTRDGVYAAHTLNANTGSIGVAACAMRGATEVPFNAGPSPMTRVQWETMVQVVAELCRFYRIPVTPTTVLGHGEVQVLLGIEQRGKWDPMRLPFAPDLSSAEVGTYFRTRVQNALLGQTEPEETPPAITLRLQGREFPDGLLANGMSLAPLRPLAQAFGWTIGKIGEETVEVKINGKASTLPCERFLRAPYVPCRELAEALQVPIRWDAAHRTVMMGEETPKNS